jgi:hypothetical protein
MQEIEKRNEKAKKKKKKRVHKKATRGRENKSKRIPENKEFLFDKSTQVTQVHAGN